MRLRAARGARDLGADHPRVHDVAGVDAGRERGGCEAVFGSRRVHAGDDHREDGERAVRGLANEARHRESHAAKSRPPPARRTHEPPGRQRGGVARRAPPLPHRHHHAGGQPRLRLPHRRRHRHRAFRGPDAHLLRRRLPGVPRETAQPGATPHEAGHGEGDRDERGGGRRDGGRRRRPRRASERGQGEAQQARRRRAAKRARIRGWREKRKRRRVPRGGDDEQIGQIKRPRPAVDHVPGPGSVGRREEPLERGFAGGKSLVCVPRGQVQAGSSRRQLQGVPQLPRGHRRRERRG